MTEENEKWWVATDQDDDLFRNGPYESREEAIEYGRKFGTDFNIGKQGAMAGVPRIYGSDVLFMVYEDMCGNYSADVVDDWPEATKEQIEELTKEFTVFFDEWIQRHKLQPKFFSITDVESFDKMSPDGMKMKIFSDGEGKPNEPES